MTQAADRVGHAKIDHATVVDELSELSIERRESILIDFAFKTLPDLSLGAGRERTGGQLVTANPHAADVLARSRGSRPPDLAAHDHVRVWIVGVPVIDGDPFEARPEVALHSSHQVPGEGAEILEIDSVFGRHNEAKLVSITPTALLEDVDVTSNSPL
jgi:hypothetical protein